MGINNTIEYEKLEKFRLDSQNPRFRSDFRDSNPSNNQIMNEMEDWKLDELAVSFLSSDGFWVQEAVLVLPERKGKSEFFTVIEGNRRIAALFKLKTIIEEPSVVKSKKWRDIVAIAEKNQIKTSSKLFNKIPYIRIERREDVDEFLGFRHVTGIEEWQPAEKAAYIAKLIDERRMSYEEVMRKIGSKTATVRQHYIAYRLLEQMRREDVLPEEGVQNRFSVMYLSLRTPGVQQRLGLDIQGFPERNKLLVEKKNIPYLKHFARWIFGDDNYPPLFSDSRQVDAFGGLLESNEAFKYLCENKDARFDSARAIAGGDLTETIANVKKASEFIRMAISQAHRYSDRKNLQDVMKDFGHDAIQLMSVFRELQREFRQKIEEKFKS
jgi:hypothetical protein